MDLTSYGPPSDAISFTTPQLSKRRSAPHSLTDTMHLTKCVPYTTTPLPPLLLLPMTVDFPPASGNSSLNSRTLQLPFPLSRSLVSSLCTLSTTIRGLAPNSPYLFRYFSRNELGDSAPSPDLKVVTGTQLQIYMCDTQTHTHSITAGAKGGATLQDSAPPSADSALVCTQSSGSPVHTPCWLRWYTSTGWHVSVELTFTVHISCDTYNTSDAFALACSTYTLPCPSPFHISLSCFNYSRTSQQITVDLDPNHYWLVNIVYSKSMSAPSYKGHSSPSLPPLPFPSLSSF